MTEDALKYPIGRLSYTTFASNEERRQRIDAVASLPGELEQAVAGMTDAQLDTPYRPEGWTVRQVVHHMADSHMHAYLRFKYALAENGAPILAYDEDEWAKLSDTKAPLAPSVALLRALHEKWGILLAGMAERDFQRTYTHSKTGPVTLDRALAVYAWHGRHHVGHALLVKNAKG